MAELALGVVGAAPLIALAIKSFKNLSSDLTTFRDCTKEVKSLNKKLNIQRKLFENEWRILLRECLDDKMVVEKMILDPDHCGWNDDEQKKKLRDFLESSYEACMDLVRDIVDAIEKLQKGLACFEEAQTKQKEGEKIKDTWKRVKDGMKLVYKKDHYKDSLDSIQKANINLTNLCKQAARLQTPCKVAVTVKRPATSQGWSDIRRAAKALHEALAGAWSCEQKSHFQHFVKLFLEAEKADENVHMDIAIMCRGGPGEASLIQLRVRSGYVAWTQTPRLFLPADPGAERPRKRAKSVRFAEERSASCTTTITSAPMSCTTRIDAQESADLRATRDFCAELMTRCGQKHSAGTRCLGHLDVHSSDPLRHSFYASPTHTRPANSGDPLPMDAFLGSAKEPSYVDRLRMARALVLAVLKFYATPWLADEWRLGDFSLFSDARDALKTIHLDVEFNERKAALQAMEDVRTSVAEEARLVYGVRNMTMHSLGVALLEIDRMQSFDLRDVAAVRTAASIPSRFGNKYHELMKKVLWCNFALGDDLGEARLQRAVYNEVIGGLESMIQALNLDDE